MEVNHTESNTGDGESTHDITSAIEAAWPLNTPIVCLDICAFDIHKVRFDRRWTARTLSHPWDDRAYIQNDLKKT
jgi:hypothetical protein